MVRNGQARASHTPGVMNGYEREYAQHLEEMKRNGEILAFEFEPVKFNIAKSTGYTPDFLVIRRDYAIEFHEVKGIWREDARVKIKAAAAKFPFFIFRAYTRPTPGTWKEEDFSDIGKILNRNEAMSVKVRDIVNEIIDSGKASVLIAPIVRDYLESDGHMIAASEYLDHAGIDLNNHRNSAF